MNAAPTNSSSPRQLRLTNKRSAGFTLIEILVGLVILGVVVGVVALSLGRDRGVGRLRVAAERAQALISTHCRQSAILQGRLIGVAFAEDEYFFTNRWEGQWLPLPEVKSEPLPAGIEVWISQDDRRVEEREDISDPPQILCLPSGELIPFELHFELPEPRHSITLKAASNGDFELGELRSEAAL
jgi:general secretion pathway protein H